MEKRASLELSINAIVVLILAITILGLGLGFIRGQFGGMTKQFTGVSAEIDKELTDKIRTSGEILTFNKENIDAKTGVADTFYIGISNTAGTPRCFKVQVNCIKPLTEGKFCDGLANGIPVGGNAPGVGTPGTSWFKVFTDVTIGGQDIGVFPVTVQIPSATQDTYLMEVDVFQSTTDPAPTDCTSALAAYTAGNPPPTYQTKQFYVTVQ